MTSGYNGCHGVGCIDPNFDEHGSYQRCHGAAASSTIPEMLPNQPTSFFQRRGLLIEMTEGGWVYSTRA
ncbi:MAG: hypothetical protein E5W09_07435 [Mesorhizobium sp.]|nr:MAG: hypothetical protein E5W09_07435 [Mesorhizobium sp.]